MSKTHSNILVVDDDVAVRTAVKKNLEVAGFKIFEAADGAEAVQILTQNKSINAIVSDIRMPNMDGIALTRFVKEKTKLPIILVTGFSELTETLDAASLGADDFIPKPFKTSDLIAALEKLSRPPAKKNQELDESDFCKLSIDDFISGSQIKFDIYIKITDSKFIKIARQGEDIDINRVKVYKAKGVRFLYMKTLDFGHYIGLNLTLLGAVDRKPAVSTSKRLNLVKHTGEIIVESLYFEGVSEESFSQGKTFVESMVNLLSQDPEIDSLLNILLEHSDALYIHSVGVALYAQMVARRIGWEAFSTLAKVTMGGLLHDIGEKEISRELLLKPRYTRSLNEVREYESHCLRGQNILTQVKILPREVVQIALQHHENCSGTGYPGRLFKEKIYPPARLIAVVDEFCNLVLSRLDDRRFTPAEALQQMEDVTAKVFDAQYFKALKGLFGNAAAIAS